MEKHTFDGIATSATLLIHQVITLGGREPDAWHWTSYCLSADKGWLLKIISTSNGLTANEEQILST